MREVLRPSLPEVEPPRRRLATEPRMRQHFMTSFAAARRRCLDDRTGCSMVLPLIQSRIADPSAGPSADQRAGSPVQQVVQRNLSAKLAAVVVAAAVCACAAPSRVSAAEEGDTGASVDMVVTDLAMPEMDGFELCERLRAHPETKDLPILYVSATSTYQRRLAEKARAVPDAYLPKPIDERALLDAVGRLLVGREVP